MYQPTWENGQEHGKGKRDAASRYAAIAEYLRTAPPFDQPLTVLDFGAYGGYFSARLTEEFGAQCTAVDDSPFLKEIAGVEIIPQRLTPGEVSRLGPFDVALCLSVLHHLTQWRTTLKALRKVSTVLFVETANPDETLPRAAVHSASPAIHSTMAEAGGVILTETPGYDAKFMRPLWVLDQRLPRATLGE